MMEDKTITVTCPKCGIKITNTVSWFKKPEVDAENWTSC